MQIISRKDAMAAGRTRYCTGKPCKHGHLAERDVLNWTCVECTLDWKRKNPERVREYSQQYHVENRVARIMKSVAYFRTVSGRATKKRYREANRDKCNTYSKEWSKNNREWCRRWAKDKYESDIQFRLKVLIRGRLRVVLRGRPKKASTMVALGCTIDECIAHIAKQFTGSMTWENWGYVWELDHIKALARFDLSNRKQFMQAANYKNLQPLLIADHKMKTATDIREIRKSA